MPSRRPHLEANPGVLLNDSGVLLQDPRFFKRIPVSFKRTPGSRPIVYVAIGLWGCKAFAGATDRLRSHADLRGLQRLR